MIKRRNLRTQNIKVFILDEADEMLNQGKFIVIINILLIFYYDSLLGFQEQIYDVYRHLPPSIQVSHMIDHMILLNHTHYR